MNLSTLFLALAMFSIPWTVSGIIHPAAAGMRGSSRMKVFGIGAGAIVLASAIAKELAVPGSKNSDAEAIIGLLWLLACIAWPLAAWAMRRKERAEGNPKPTPTAKPWEGAKPKPLTAEQRQSLGLQPDPTPTQQDMDRARAELADAAREFEEFYDRHLLHFDDTPKPKKQTPAPPQKPAKKQKQKASPAPTPTPDSFTDWLTERANDDDRFADLCPEPVEPCSVAFLYENAQGEITSREVIVDQVGTSHFAGLCKREVEDRTFRFDRILGNATLTESNEEISPRKLRDRLRGYDQRELRRRKQAAAKTSPEILFTGFKRDRRAELEAIAQAAGMVVRKNVTTQLDFLCAGSNAGPTKLAEARERGVMVLDEQQLLQMLETGEVPA